VIRPGTRAILDSLFVYPKEKMNMSDTETWLNRAVRKTTTVVALFFAGLLPLALLSLGLVVCVDVVRGLLDTVGATNAKPPSDAEFAFAFFGAVTLSVLWVILRGAERILDSLKGAPRTNDETHHVWTDTDDFVELWYAADEKARHVLRARWRNQGLGMLAKDPRILNEVVGRSKKIG